MPSRERFEETTKLGRAFVDVTQAAWPCRVLAHLQDIWLGAIAYPVAVGTACAGQPGEHGLEAGVIAAVQDPVVADEEARRIAIGFPEEVLGDRRAVRVATDRGHPACHLGRPDPVA